MRHPRNSGFSIILHRPTQGLCLLKNFGGPNLYCLRFDDATMFTQP